MLVKSEKTLNIEPIKAGMCRAVCSSVIDLGTHINKFNPERSQRKVMLIWETDTTYATEEGAIKPRSISKEVVLSLHEKATLRKIIESWNSYKFSEEEAEKGIYLEEQIGKSCLLNISHSKKEDKIYASIDSVTPLMEGLKPLKIIGGATYFSMDKGLDGFEKLPNYIQKKIEQTPEYRRLMGQTPSQNHGQSKGNLELVEDDDLPF